MESESKVSNCIDKALSLSGKLGCEYADVRVENKQSEAIQVKDGSIEELNAGNMCGIGVRVLYKGFFGFSATNKLGDVLKAVRSAAKSAASVCSRGSKEDRIVLDYVKPHKASVKTPVKIHPNSVSADEKIKLLEDSNTSARGVSEYIKSVATSYLSESGQKIYANSEGTFIKNDFTYFKYIVIPIARKNDNIQKSYEKAIFYSGFDKLVESDPAALAKKAASVAVSLLNAKGTPAGRMTVILHPSIVGLFAHEAVGHASEADHILSKTSVLNGQLGSRVAPVEVSVVDSGTIKTINGYYEYDDEGVKSQKTYIIKKGVFNSYLHTRETASKFKTKPTGNARAQSFGFKPIPRMSSTYFDKGNYDFEEMISETKKGVYLQGFNGGQVSPADGTFMFGVERGYIIENGKKKQLIKGGSISGKILAVLKNIDAVGRDLEVKNSGLCGKDGQYVPVSEGGPHLRVKDMLVGGGN